MRPRLLRWLLERPVVVLHDTFVVADLAELLTELGVLLDLGHVAPPLLNDLLINLLILIVRVDELFGGLALSVAGSWKFVEGQVVDRESEAVVQVVNIDSIFDVPLMPLVHP